MVVDIVEVHPKNAVLEEGVVLVSKYFLFEIIEKYNDDPDDKRYHVKSFRDNIVASGKRLHTEEVKWQVLSKTIKFNEKRGSKNKDS